MKLLFENWRGFLNEVTAVPNEIKDIIWQTIEDSRFWEEPNTVDVRDVEGESNKIVTPATHLLQVRLNQMMEEARLSLYFDVTSGDDQYVLGPDDPYGKPLSNWMMGAQYRGPYEEQGGRHVIWLEIRPVVDNLDLAAVDANDLVKTIATTINHELVHYVQLKKQAESKGLSDSEAYKEMVCDTKQVPVGDPDEYRELCGQEPPEEEYTGREQYVTRHGEIDAFASEAAEQLIDSYGAEEALNAMRKLTPLDLDKYPEISDVVNDYAGVLKDNPEELNKFRKKLYLQIQQQGRMNEVINKWRVCIDETSI
mgnify:FL=1